MLITLCYIYLWMRFQRHYTAVIRSALHRLSAGQSSFTFCALKPERTDLPREHALFLRLGDRVIYITEPQVCVDLSKWTLLGSSLICGRRIESVAFIIQATSRQNVPASPYRTEEKVLNWSDYCVPLAYSPGQPYRAIAEASLDNFSRLGVAFMEDRLHMGNGLVPEKIVSVLLRETALRELFEQQQDGRRIEAEPTERRDSPQLPQEEPELPSEHQHMDGHHLHLSSCHECRELENSTILSVKFASVENIPDLPDDYATADEEEERGRRISGGKPPNVLVFTGGCEEQFQKIRSLLVECVDTDRYAIYHLRPQQALSEPWLDNTLLLVLATDQTLTPQLQLRFLSYLSRGGKLLGLSSSLCPAGLTLRPRDTQSDRICSLTFTKSDSTELQLSVLSSGSVFERDGASGGDVELWGEISAQDEREMAIVRVTHGVDSGEAVLCQVRLETAPDAQGSAGFSELKMSNARRYEVLTEILTSLGLSCELSQVPPHSPVYLLSTDTEQAGRFLCWLRAQAGDSGGVLRSAAGGLKVVWAGDEPPDLCEGECVLHTEPPESFSEHFSLQTYRQHLQTQRLGRTVLYADITSSTMDLLHGMMLQSPQEVGLIAIAARQTQGKGRGGNAWLSPLGCAMFTLHLQLPVDSRLGQRIPFLQHLAALAVVESVRTLPGYEDVDLRLKWPNDIYYSNLMKLGGVLVNSTVTGHTFSLLIGCGFNVSNSNPTVCINDLVLQQNLDTLAPDQLIARSVTLLERFVSDFQLRGPQALLPLYYSRWVHSGTRVRLWSEDGPEAEVVGLDENGFLQVRTGEQVVSVQPDGNSFDMLRNLVVTKTS